MSSSEKFEIKTDAFEGPLDLLLDLIEKRKLFINDISLATVTDDFISYVKTLDQAGSSAYLEKSSHFILVASTLLLIKSKSLLPGLNLTVEEEQSVSDLEKRLSEYQKIKELSVHVRALFGRNVIFEKSGSRAITPIFAPDQSMNIFSLHQAMLSLINSLPKLKEKLPEVVVKQIMSLEDMIDNLSQRITNNLKMTFREWSKDHKMEKVNVIVGFLAMLELVKNGALRVEQYDTFGDIHMETDKVGTPRYI